LPLRKKLTVAQAKKKLLHGQSSAAELVKENNFVEYFNEHAKEQCCGAGASRSWSYSIYYGMAPAPGSLLFEKT
jgi:hypothetical protein